MNATIRAMLTTSEKLRAAIATYADPDKSDRSLAAAKGSITKLVNQLATEIGGGSARSTAIDLVKARDWSGFPEREQRLKNQFTFGSVVLEHTWNHNDKVQGWYSQNQAQAEFLPLSHREQREYRNREEVECFGVYEVFGNLEDIWSDRGFASAIDLPVVHCSGSTPYTKVQFDIEQTQFWAEYGFATPCPLQWQRQIDESRRECLFVDRSILSAGYWRAYKWWAGCQWWYLERHPEWFADAPTWGSEPEAQPELPIPEPGSAVLGGRFAGQRILSGEPAQSKMVPRWLDLKYKY